MARWTHWIKESVETVSSKGGIFTFLRAQLSSQLSSITDFIVTILLVNVFNLFYVYATFIGSVCGGITNCIVNYRWTFKVMDVKKRYIAIRYLAVWGGSIFLNTSGTYLMTELLKRIPWLMKLSHLFFENIFIIPKIIVSLLVGFVWNYNMHRHFVYKDLHLKQLFFNLKQYFHSHDSNNNTK
ncbi:MAG: GtrA family protein [Candidatus Azobacteroides sp.]|nr:GtrA family protein [Candidatus Azobacteroides sp.]